MGNPSQQPAQNSQSTTLFTENWRKARKKAAELRRLDQERRPSELMLPDEDYRIYFYRNLPHDESIDTRYATPYFRSALLAVDQWLLSEFLNPILRSNIDVILDENNKAGMARALHFYLTEQNDPSFQQEIETVLQLCSGKTVPNWQPNQFLSAPRILRALSGKMTTPKKSLNDNEKSTMASLQQRAESLRTSPITGAIDIKGSAIVESIKSKTEQEALLWLSLSDTVLLYNPAKDDNRQQALISFIKTYFSYQEALKLYLNVNSEYEEECKENIHIQTWAKSHLRHYLLLQEIAADEDACQAYLDLLENNPDRVFTTNQWHELLLMRDPYRINNRYSEYLGTVAYAYKDLNSLNGIPSELTFLGKYDKDCSHFYWGLMGTIIGMLIISWIPPFVFISILITAKPMAEAYSTMFHHSFTTGVGIGLSGGLTVALILAVILVGMLTKLAAQAYVKHLQNNANLLEHTNQYTSDKIHTMNGYMYPMNYSQQQVNPYNSLNELNENMIPLMDMNNPNNNNNNVQAYDYNAYQQEQPQGNYEPYQQQQPQNNYEQPLFDQYQGHPMPRYNYNQFLQQKQSAQMPLTAKAPPPYATLQPQQLRQNFVGMGGYSHPGNHYQQPPTQQQQPYQQNPTYARLSNNK